MTFVLEFGLMFKSNSSSLKDLFSQPGAAYYIPFYQRPYSWDLENIKKLMDDLISGVNRLTSNSDELRFFGTLILLTESQPQKDVHFDRPNLITSVRNVIDGQQRISTIAVLACLLVEKMEELKVLLEGHALSIPEINDLVDTLANCILDLTVFYSVEVRKTGSKPEQKPLIVRALNQSTSPRTDQWTLNGPRGSYYLSEVAALLAQFIETKKVGTTNTNEKLAKNIDEMKRYLNGVADPNSKNIEYPTAAALLATGNRSDAGLAEGVVNVINLPAAGDDVRDAVYGATRVLAFVNFLQHRSFVTVIECPNEALAFDMFQSLNATGTPLTAFEVFKPLIVNTLGSSYGTSVSKRFVDAVEGALNEEVTAAEKGRVTDQMLAHAALPYDGTEISTRFSQQRDWLNRIYTSCDTLAQEEFLQWLSNAAEYVQEVIRPTQPKRGETKFPLAERLVRLGVTAADADLAALCIYFLKDAQHRMAHYLLAVFYARLVRAQENPATVSSASADFVGVCKAAAAFFTLWAASNRRHPDEVYRNLFRKIAPKTGAARAHMSWSGGAANQTLSFVSKHFLAALVDAEAYDPKSVPDARAKWIAKARLNLGYGKKVLCRWALFVTAHDTAPDTSSGNEGLLVIGRPGSAPYLNCASWFSDDYEVIEHVANREKPANIKYQSLFDDHVYPGNYSVVDQIGNLTLWSRSANSSTYPEWPDKVLYYGSLTSLEPSKPASLTKMADALGLSAVPPALSHLAAASRYQAHLAPIADRGMRGLRWDAAFVSKRTERLCGLTFDVLNAWLL